MATFTEWTQYYLGDRPPVHRATSPNLAALYPLFSESGLVDPKTCKKVLGQWVGYCGLNRSGGVFCFDEFQLYKAGLINNLNVIVLGEIGMRKSSLVKSMIYRGSAVGYNHLVTDFKGEYSELAEAVGGKVLRFGQNTRNYINPLDERMDFDTRLDLTESLVATAMRLEQPNLPVIKRSLLEIAMRDALGHYGQGIDQEATLPAVVKKLFEPTAAMCDAMFRSSSELREWGFEMALALQRLTEGELKGLFHKPTSEGLFEETPLLVMECKDVKGDAAAIITLLFNYFTQSQLGSVNGRVRFHRVIHDESWALAAYPAFVESVRRAFKLGRSQGIANWIVVHHLNNLYRSGHHEAVKDLIADSDTRIIYRQDKAEVEQTATELELNEAEKDWIVGLSPGRAIWKVGLQPGLDVEYERWPEEVALTTTTPFQLETA